MKLYEEIFKLKTLTRKGWKLIGAQSEEGRVESTAEHTFSMIILALEIMHKENLKLDQQKVLKMIAYHDLCEIDFGDHTPYDGLDEGDVYKGEHKCMQRLAKEYDMPEVLKLWLEYEEGKTPEAKFVEKIDKLDSIMQSKIYSKICNDEDIFKQFYNRKKEIAEEFKSYIFLQEE